MSFIANRTGTPSWTSAQQAANREALMAAKMPWSQAGATAYQVSWWDALVGDVYDWLYDTQPDAYALSASAPVLRAGLLEIIPAAVLVELLERNAVMLRTANPKLWTVFNIAVIGLRERE